MTVTRLYLHPPTDCPPTATKFSTYSANISWFYAFQALSGEILAYTNQKLSNRIENINWKSEWCLAVKVPP
jgi:hypothetical protein